MADNELDEYDQLVNVRKKTTPAATTVKSIRADGVRSVTVLEPDDYTAYAYVAEITENGVNKHFRVEMTYVDGHFVVYSCTEMTA